MGPLSGPKLYSGIIPVLVSVFTSLFPLSAQFVRFLISTLLFQISKHTGCLLGRILYLICLVWSINFWYGNKFVNLSYCLTLCRFSVIKDGCLSLIRVWIKFHQNQIKKYKSTYMIYPIKVPFLAPLTPFHFKMVANSYKSFAYPFCT